MTLFELPQVFFAEGEDVFVKTTKECGYIKYYNLEQDMYLIKTHSGRDHHWCHPWELSPLRIDTYQDWNAS